MRIAVKIVDVYTDQTLLALGDCITDNVGRALAMYEDELVEYEEAHPSALCDLACDVYDEAGNRTGDE